MKKFSTEPFSTWPEDGRNSGASTETDEPYRHWSPTSQPYASADVLLQYLVVGWTVERTVAFEEFCYGGARYTRIYYFRLVYVEEFVWMPVLENPVVLRLIQDHGLNLHRVAPHCEANTVESECCVDGDPSAEPDTEG